jgi:hypothetical protein
MCFKTIPAVALCVLLGAATVQGTGTDEVKSAQVKAGLVYRLSESTAWPDGIFELETTPITVGVLGDDPYGFADYFHSQSESFTAQGRHFVVRKLSFQVADEGTVDMAPALKTALRECEVLFVTAAETRHLSQILAAVAKSGVLTVGETETFSVAGGMVTFVVDQGVVKIWVNLQALKNERIQASSDFLRHAQIVEGTNEPN